MANVSIEEQLQKLLPESVDDIIRKNRDELRLTLATEDELKALGEALADGPVTHRLTGWNILMMHVSSERGHASSPRLIGNVVGTGEPWITSHVLGVDFPKGLVKTKNSFYQVTGPRATEEDTNLLHICAVLHEWGFGARYGVPHIFY